MMFGVCEPITREHRQKWVNNPHLSDLTTWINSYVSPWVCVWRPDKSTVLSSNDSRVLAPSGISIPTGTTLGFLLDFDNDVFVLFIDGKQTHILSTMIKGKTLLPCYSVHYDGDSIALNTLCVTVPRQA